MKAIWNYFALYEPEAMLGARRKNIWDRLASRGSPVWIVALYLGSCAGVVGQQALESIDSGAWTSGTVLLLRGCIVGAVILPAVFKAARLNRVKPSLMHVFVCFQHGFFWQTLLDKLAPPS